MILKNERNKIIFYERRKDAIDSSAGIASKESANQGKRGAKTKEEGPSEFHVPYCLQGVKITEKCQLRTIKRIK